MGDAIEEEDLSEESAAANYYLIPGKATGRNLLRAKSKPDRNAALHLPENSLRHGPVHRILQSTLDLLKVIICQQVRYAKCFIEIWSANVKFGDHVPPTQHGVSDCDRR